MAACPNFAAAFRSTRLLAGGLRGLAGARNHLARRTPRSRRRRSRACLLPRLRPACLGRGRRGHRWPPHRPRPPPSPAGNDDERVAAGISARPTSPYRECPLCGCGEADALPSPLLGRLGAPMDPPSPPPLQSAAATGPAAMNATSAAAPCVAKPRATPCWPFVQIGPMVPGSPPAADGHPPRGRGVRKCVVKH